MEFTTQEQLIEYFKQMISTREDWAIRALIVVYENQTKSEQAQGSTHYTNNIGFRRAGSKKLSKYARIYKSGCELYPNVIEELKQEMPLYANQLVHQCIESGKIKKINGKYVW